MDAVLGYTDVCGRLLRWYDQESRHDFGLKGPSAMIRTIQGVIRGKTIEFTDEIDLPDGQPVEIIVRPARGNSSQPISETEPGERAPFGPLSAERWNPDC